MPMQERGENPNALSTACSPCSEVKSLLFRNVQFIHLCGSPKAPRLFYLRSPQRVILVRVLADISVVSLTETKQLYNRLQKKRYKVQSCILRLPNSSRCGIHHAAETHSIPNFPRSKSILFFIGCISPIFPSSSPISRNECI